MRWSKRARKTGSAAAYAMGGHRPWSLEPERDWLMAPLSEKPDLTLHALLTDVIEKAIVEVVLEGRQRCAGVAVAHITPNADRASKIAEAIRRAEAAVIAGHAARQW